MQAAQIDDSSNAAWEQFYGKTKEVILGYAAVVVYYVKATHPKKWKDLVEEEEGDRTPGEVLQLIMKHRASMDAVGTHKSLYELASQLHDFFDSEPDTKQRQMDFHSLAVGFVELLPFYDAFPLNLDEKLEDRSAQLRKTCGVFYTLQFKLDMPLRWFHFYAKAFRKAEEEEKKQGKKKLSQILNEELNRNKDPLESDSGERCAFDDVAAGRLSVDEDELHMRHVLSGEPLDVVLGSIKRKRKNREALRQERTDDGDTQQDSSPDRSTYNNPLYGASPSSSHESEPETADVGPDQDSQRKVRRTGTDSQRKVRRTAAE